MLEGDTSGRRIVVMKKIILFAFLALFTCVGVFAGGSSEKLKPVVMVWYPNESGEDLKGAREEFVKMIAEATGRPVEQKLTTDYTIAIEAIANNKADVGFFGAQGYIEANAKNPKVVPLVVNSGASGTLSDAVYYSWVCVRLGNEGLYKNGNGYSVDNIQGKKYSWVSTSSTSGFKVPSAYFVSYFGKKPAFATLKADDLLEGGKDKFFSEVLYGNSHQGSAFNLVTGKVDAASFCDTSLANYVDLVSGTASTVGAVYQIKKDAADPFTTVPGEKFFLIQSIPVLNAPFIVNSATLSAAEIAKLREVFTRDSTTQTENIFVPKGAAQKGMFAGGQKFLVVADSWFQPIRDLSK